MRVMTHSIGLLLLVSLLTAVSTAGADGKGSTGRHLESGDDWMQAYCLHTATRPMTVCEVSLRGADAEEIRGFVLHALPDAEVLYTTAREHNRRLGFAGSSGVLVFDGVVRVDDTIVYTVLEPSGSSTIVGPGFDTTKDRFGPGAIA